MTDTSIYQSNGACNTQCSADYAFAVLQGQDCWCSNYIPASTVDVSECNTSCPGYPSDLCGNTDKGYYGYIAMSGHKASGTATGKSTATATDSSSSSTTSSVSDCFLHFTPLPCHSCVYNYPGFICQGGLVQSHSVWF